MYGPATYKETKEMSFYFTLQNSFQNGEMSFKIKVKIPVTVTTLPEFLKLPRTVAIVESECEKVTKWLAEFELCKNIEQLCIEMEKLELGF